MKLNQLRPLKLSKTITPAFLFWVVGFLYAAEPEITKIKSSISGVDQAVKAVYVSAEEKNSSPTLPNLLFKPDLASIEIEAIDQLIEDKSVPDKEKELTLIRYTMGDPRITGALIKAKKKGIKVTLITDLNPVMKGNFSQIQGTFTTAFSKAELKDPDKSEGAKVIQELLDAGFELKKDILSQPLYSPDLERVPIMHEKALLLQSGEKKTAFFGTANLARNPRYNRLFEVQDPVFFDAYREHVDALSELYKKGKETSEIAPAGRTLIQYPDGTEMELAFTDGQYNPNDRIVDILKNNSLEHIDLSHFVMTHRGFFNALGEAISKNPEATGYAVTDDRFSAIKGWGLSPALAGVEVVDPYNRKFTGLKPSAFGRIESFVYQRPAVDPDTGKVRVERSEDGPPSSRHVWHDKTTLIDFKDKTGKERTALFTGSFNLSNNVANSEFQVQFNLPRDSWIRKAVKHSIEEVVSNEPQWAVPTLEASLRNAVALVLGVTDLEIPLEQSSKLLNAIDHRNFSEMKQILNHLKETRTQLSSKLDTETKDERVDQFISFLDWYAKNIPPSNAEFNVRAQRTIEMALVIAQPAMKDHIKANLLSQVIDRPQLSIEEQHKLLNGAFKALGLGEVNPWSGMESTLLSLESILSPEALAEKEKNPNTPLAVLIGKKIDEGDFTWKGPAFEKFVQALQSEMGISILSLISAGKVPADEIVQFSRLLNEKRKALELPNELKPLPKSHVFETTDSEKLEERLRKLFNSQAKKGILASTVMSNDKQFVATLNRIKRNQTGVLENFKIQIPKNESQKDELAPNECAKAFGQLH
jgi:phosphatidylserine/phosphatidylglycerophosphate/cardiolipin synthase-like enzyme